MKICGRQPGAYAHTARSTPPERLFKALKAKKAGEQGYCFLSFRPMGFACPKAGCQSLKKLQKLLLQSRAGFLIFNRLLLVCRHFPMPPQIPPGPPTHEKAAPGGLCPGLTPPQLTGKWKLQCLSDRVRLHDFSWHVHAHRTCPST